MLWTTINLIDTYDPLEEENLFRFNVYTQLINLPGQVDGVIALGGSSYYSQAFA
jgi:hypothetical protein